MSMKEFDKLCESIILDKPGSRPIIYDERQKHGQMKAALTALCIFSGLIFVNTFIMESVYQWTEWSSAAVLFAMISYAVAMIMLIATDCFFGVKTQRAAQSFLVGMFSVLFLINIPTWLDEGEDFCAVRNGMLTRELMMLIVEVIFLLPMVYYFIHRHFEKKQEKAEDAEQ